MRHDDLCLARRRAGKQRDNYRNCVSWVTTDPVRRRRREAERWRDTGGGLPARHCRALALGGPGEVRRCGDRSRGRRGGNGERGRLCQSSGPGGGVPYGRRAMPRGRGFSSTGRWPPRRIMPEALDGRARAAAAFRDFTGAIADLDRLLVIQPGNAEALALRAAAKRQSGDQAQGGLADCRGSGRRRSQIPRWLISSAARRAPSQATGSAPKRIGRKPPRSIPAVRPGNSPKQIWSVCAVLLSLRSRHRDAQRPSGRT